MATENKELQEQIKRYTPERILKRRNIRAAEQTLCAKLFPKPPREHLDTWIDNPTAKAKIHDKS